MLLDQGLFTVYKRLFAACLALNAAALVLTAAGKFPYAKSHATTFALGNILALVICRSEAVLRVVFWLAVKALGHGFVPLRLKTAATSFLQSLGGVHSGCGVSSIAWLVYAIVLALNECRDRTQTEIIAIACTILALLTLSSLAAFPLLRHLHHNVFERTHRLAGWAALGLLWLFIVLTISYDPTTKKYTNPRTKLLKAQEFYLTIAITFLILLPWLTIKQVDVAVTTPSNHASLIHFAGGVKAGILGRISRNPLSEWHAFGIISDGETGHIMLAGTVGDFTRKLVTDPPRRLWVRSVGFAGLPYLVRMYKKVALVATGSGICVFLSFLLQSCKDVDVCLVWVAKGIEENFGRDIKEMLSGFPAGKVVVHDTAVAGRPNVGEMAVAAARRWDAEVVVVTSNPEGSRDVVNACEEAKIPAFGPIWDS